ncbi:MAG: hypothetical protein V7711_18690 [Pseudomonadales bacterium]
MTPDTAWAWPWWSTMVVLNTVSLIVCLTIFNRARNTAGGFSNIADPYQKRMLVMGLVFTLVGAYRSVFVSRYLFQFAWFDVLANSSLLIRFFAIFAELSFAGLFAYAMLRLNKDIPGRTQSNPALNFIGTKSPYLLIACIFAAQFFATTATVNKNNTLFAIEETLWTVGFVCILPLAFVQFRRALRISDAEEKLRHKMLITSSKVIFSWCAVYCSYGIFFHLPLEFWSDNATSVSNAVGSAIPVAQAGMAGVSDAFFVVNETKEYSDWGFGFLFWHSSYFSVCVWLAIFLMRAPRAIKPID